MYFKMYQALHLDVPAPEILLMYILLNEIITYQHPLKPFVLSLKVTHTHFFLPSQLYSWGCDVLQGLGEGDARTFRRGAFLQASVNQKPEGKQEMEYYWKRLNKKNGGSEYYTGI